MVTKLALTILHWNLMGLGCLSSIVVGCQCTGRGFQVVVRSNYVWA